MGNSRSFLMLVVAAIAAMFAVVVAVKWLNKQAGQVEQVVVAARNISFGQKISEGDLTLIKWPAGKVPNDTFHDLKPLIGRTIKSALVINEPVLGSKLAPEGVNGGLSAVIPEGKRAITVKVNEVIGVAGFALPGNFVDIIVNTKKEDGSGDLRNAKSISKTMLEHIMVLAVGEEVDRDDTKPKKVNVVTLEVSPEQAEMIDLARSVGELSLVLRNQADGAASATSGVTLTQLLQLPEEAPVIEHVVVTSLPAPKSPAVTVAPVPAKKQFCTKVLNGLNEAQECF